MTNSPSAPTFARGLRIAVSNRASVHSEIAEHAISLSEVLRWPFASAELGATLARCLRAPGMLRP
jgi:hypothetical protein